MNSDVTHNNNNSSNNNNNNSNNRLTELTNNVEENNQVSDEEKNTNLNKSTQENGILTSQEIKYVLNDSSGDNKNKPKYSAASNHTSVTHNADSRNMINYEDLLVKGGTGASSKYNYGSNTNIPINLNHHSDHSRSVTTVQSNITTLSVSTPSSSSTLDMQISYIPKSTKIEQSSDNNDSNNTDTDLINNVDYNCQKINKCPSKVSSCSTSATPEPDNLSWPTVNQFSRVGSDSIMALNNISISNIGSTSQGTCGYLRPNINNGRDMSSRECPGPSGVRISSQIVKSDRRDSSSGNEGEDFSSDGEDYCIYTYKGNNESTIDDKNRESRNSCNVNNCEAGAVMAPSTSGLQSSGRSSPEMDFLEMDFDPGPSCEQDTGDSDLASINEDIQNIALDNIESDPAILNDLSSGKVISRQTPTPQQSFFRSSSEPNVHVEMKCQENETTLDKENTKVQELSATNNHNHASQCALVPPNNISNCTVTATRKLGQICQHYYNNAGIPSRESHGYHNTSGDLISPGDNRDADTDLLWNDPATLLLPENHSASFQWLKVNLTSTLWHRMMAKKLMLHKQTTPFSHSGESNLEHDLSNVDSTSGTLRPVERIMLWSEQEAALRQVTQIGTSACGATSALNALYALEVPFVPEVLIKGVATRLRDPGSPLPRYLISRSMAGATHKDIIRGLTLAANESIVTKFFSFYPARAISLSHWLYYWISRGAVPIATVNLQNCGNRSRIPDAWHHQMIFGVSSAGIYMANPLECLPEQHLLHQLVSPSVLLIRRSDVLAHWNPNTDLEPLKEMDYRWRRLNVFGQVVNMIREASGENRQPGTAGSTVRATHIRIPASYQSGITMVMRSDVAAAEELLNAEQLPLLF